MFTRLVADIAGQAGGRLSLFVDYLQRHISVDAERHGPMAARLLEKLYGDDERRWGEARLGARTALLARREFWDGVLCAIEAARQERALGAGASKR